MLVVVVFMLGLASNIFKLLFQFQALMAENLPFNVQKNVVLEFGLSNGLELQEFKKGFADVLSG